MARKARLVCKLQILQVKGVQAPLCIRVGYVLGNQAQGGFPEWPW